MDCNINLKKRIIQNYDHQADFAADVKEQPGVVSNVLRGRAELAPWRQLKWARVLKTDPNEIFV